MVARKRRRSPRKKLGTRFKQNPVGTTKSEFKKLGIIGQAAVIGIAAGALSPQASNTLNKLPIVGSIMGIFTSWGRKLSTKMK